MRKVSIILFVAIFSLGLAAVAHADPTSQALVVEGRALAFNEGLATYSGLIAANDKFSAAVVADAADQEANFFYAASRVLKFALEQPNSDRKSVV